MPRVTSWLSPFSPLPLFHHAIYNIFTIMSRLDSSTDPHIKKTLSQFSEEKCRDRQKGKNDNKEIMKRQQI
jgi:hypothetical protein